MTSLTESFSKKRVREETDEEIADYHQNLQFETLSTDEPLRKLRFIFTVERPNCCCICQQRFSSDSKRVLRSTDRSKHERVEELSCSVLRSLCDNTPNHLLWLPEHCDNVQKIRFVIERLRSNKNINTCFNRICTTCFEKSIVSNILLRPNTLTLSEERFFVRCPLCPTTGNAEDDEDSFIDISKLFKFFSEENSILVKKALQKEKLERNRAYFHCPIVGCSHSEFVEKKDSSTKLLDVTSCPNHGKFCTNCFLAINKSVKNHECGGLPAEVYQAELPANWRRCVFCNALIEKNGGCEAMACRCGKQFNWNAAIAPKRQTIEIKK